MQIFVDGLIFQKDQHSGIARVFRELLPRMCALDPELEIVLFLDGPLVSLIPNHQQITLRRTPAVRATFRPRGVWRKIAFPFRSIFREIWNRSRPIWVESYSKAIWHSTFYTWMPKWRGPEVVTVHDMIPERFPDIYNDPMDELGRKQKRICVERASMVVCVSESTRLDLIERYPKNPDLIRVVRNASSDVFIPKNIDMILLDNIPRNPFIMYVGSRNEYKNFNGLLKAYSVWKRNSEIGLVVVGQPWSDRERNFIDKLGIYNRIVLQTGVSDNLMCDLYNCALGLIFPSLAEGFGLPILEAMACGCPVVASRIPSSLEVGGDCPIYFDLYERGSLIQALDQLAHEGRRSQRSQAGISHASHYSWDQSAREMLEVYRQVNIQK